MFNVTPLRDATLAVAVILTLATLAQLGIAISYAIRGRSPHLVPGVAAIFAFLLLFVSYGLLIPNLLVLYITDDLGFSLVSYQVIINLDTASSLFSGWSDPAVFLAVVLVIRDRYLTYDGKDPNGGKPGLPLLFMIISCFLALMMVVFISASVGVFHAAIISNISFDDLNAKIAISNHLLYASTGFYVLATILLIPFAFVVKQTAKSDKIMNMTIFAIIPLLCLRAVAQLTLVIIRARNVNFGSINEDAFAFAEITSTGFLYLAAISILCYFLLSIRQWIGLGDSAPQQYYYGPPGSQQPFQGGLQPVAQFPGQWGYPGMQPQQGYVQPNIPYQTYPAPQGGGYYSNQLPGNQHVQQYVQEPFQPNQRPAVVPAPGVAEL